MKKYFFTFLMAILVFGFTTTVSAKGEIGDIITHGDMVDKGNYNGVLLQFTNTNGNEIIC